MAPRNWKRVDFFCRKCAHSGSRHMPPPQPTARVAAHQPYATTATNAYSNSYAPYPQQPSTYTYALSYPSSDVRTNGHGAAYGHPPQQIPYGHYQPPQPTFAPYPTHTPTPFPVASASASPATSAPPAAGYADTNGYTPSYVVRFLQFYMRSRLTSICSVELPLARTLQLRDTAPLRRGSPPMHGRNKGGQMHRMRQAIAKARNRNRIVEVLEEDSFLFFICWPTEWTGEAVLAPWGCCI